MRDVSFGQYYPVKSFIHKLDARIKLVTMIAYLVMIFFIPTIGKFLDNGGSVDEFFVLAGAGYAIAFVTVTTMILLSRVPPLKVLKSIKNIMFLLVFMAIISVLFYGGKQTGGLFSIKKGIFKISGVGIINAVAMMLRLIFLVMGPAILTLTTTPVELTDALESLLTPLKWIGLPVRDFAMIMSITLRLIPTLIEETGKIMNAQKARCADFESGNIFKRAKAMMPILIPLFISSFRRAEELADAMDSRCYRGAKGRTRMKKMRLKWYDLCYFVVFAGIFVGVIALKYNYFSLATYLLGLIL